MNIGGGEAADQLVRMMLSGSEVAVRLSGSALKNVLALSMALAKNHKTISGKVNLAKMLRETRDVRKFTMSPEQYQEFRKRAGKQKLLCSAIRDTDGHGKVVDVIMPVTEIDRANLIFGRIQYLTKISTYKLITISGSKDLTDAFLMARDILEVDLSNCITT